MERPELVMYKTDLLIKQDQQLVGIVEEFAMDDSAFLREVAAAWTKLSNADRFKGPTGNVCN